MRFTSEEEISLENRAARDKASAQSAYSDKEKGEGGYNQQKFNKERFEEELADRQSREDA